MNLNAQRHMAALGIQSMFLPTPYGGASIEWVNAFIGDAYFNIIMYKINMNITNDTRNLCRLILPHHTLYMYVALLMKRSVG